MPNLNFPYLKSLRYSIAVMACLLVSNSLYAQAEEPAVEAIKPGEEIFQVIAPKSKLRMIELDTRIIELNNRIRIVDGFNDTIISVTALNAHQVRILAESNGVTSLKLVDEFDNVHLLEVFVEPDTRELEAYLQRLFPGSTLEVVGVAKESVVLRGWVTDPTEIPQIMAVAEEFYPTVHNQINVGGVSQIALHVKVMEVQRSKMRELGFNFLLLGQQYMFASTPGGITGLQSVTSPFGGPPTATAATGENELSFAITGSSDVFRGFLKALQSEALAKVLAEPVLVTTSGRPATMLSGGEFPVLVPQGVGATAIEFKEFGVRMEAVPIILGNNRLRLDIAPEVSDRDVSNAVTVGGLVVPGISVRRVNTQVEMRFGETLMIGGLISTRRSGSTSKIPFLGELPWIGAAFSRKTYSDGETELLILVTPQIAAPMAPGQVPALGPGEHTDIPVDSELYWDGLLEVPVYGQDCEINGPCGPYDGQLITPTNQYQGSMPSNVPPNAIIDSARTDRQQSDIQTVGGAVTRTTDADTANYQFTTRVDRTPTNESDASTSSTEGPGLIEPDSSNEDRSRYSSAKKKRTSIFGR